MIKITECPRDAMQGVERFIPTELKVKYINALLKVGFDVIDCGSFVSQKAIPQLKDTSKVLSSLDLSQTKSQLLSIVANQRGAYEAASHDQISIIGFPFSVSEQFQLRNTNKTRENALFDIQNIKLICDKSDKKLRVYMSMGFGNPYEEPFSSEIVLQWAKKLTEIGVEEIALSDTIGVAEPDLIESLFKLLVKNLKGIEISAHFHSSPNYWEEKVRKAFDAGCLSFDSAIGGFGGCPLAEDKLVGNLATENLVDFFSNQIRSEFNLRNFQASVNLAKEIFG
jgi:hydroxymethylglutaryl-CoA lyase